MNRKIAVLIISIMLTSLSSCLDAIEYISLDENGDMELSFMLTVSKSLFEMGGSEDGQSIEDAFSEDIFDPDELSAMIPAARDVDVRLVDSDVDYGYLYKFTIPGGYIPDDRTPMVPRVTADGIEILLGMPAAEDDNTSPKKGKKKSGKGAVDQDTDELGGVDELDELGRAIFSGAKYKIQISKKILEHAERAYLESENGEITVLDLIDLGDNYLVNLPILFIMEPEEETRLFLTF